MTKQQMFEANVWCYVASAFRACVSEGRAYSPILPKVAA
jgi:hypothetical protein